MICMVAFITNLFFCGDIFLSRILYGIVIKVGTIRELKVIEECYLDDITNKRRTTIEI